MLKNTITGFLLSSVLTCASQNFYEDVLKQEPGNARAHLELAQIHLANGNYIQGWQELEWRLGTPPECTQEIKRYLHAGASLKNKKIVLRAEWGAGDTLMLIRYAQLLHSLGAYVMVHLLHESLMPLFKKQSYIQEVWGPKDPCPPFHFQIPMMSLPMIFETTVETVPHAAPYLSIDFQSSYSCPKKVGFKNVGICWHGNTIHGEEKFMPLSYFEQLSELASIKLYSLQQHHGLDQIKKLKNTSHLHIFDSNFDAIPFFDTIAIMKQLDLVISVDTSIAHLAGALGIPVWVILPKDSDWRWMLNRNDSPWYTSMRLFRQKKVGDWDDILKELKAALLSNKKT